MTPLEFEAFWSKAGPVIKDALYQAWPELDCCSQVKPSAKPAKTKHHSAPQYRALLRSNRKELESAFGINQEIEPGALRHFVKERTKLLPGDLEISGNSSPRWFAILADAINKMPDMFARASRGRWILLPAPIAPF